MPLLEVKSLKTHFYTDEGIVKAVDGVSFHVDSGETIALVGESGCGKTISVYSILRLIQPPGKIVAGEVVYSGVDLLKMPEKAMEGIRGKEISIVFQEASATFDPLFTIGHQIKEMIETHEKNTDKQEVQKKARHLLDIVNIPDAMQRMNSYPFELSGGMLQRAMIALAISCNPKVLIADEPTTSVDASNQLQLLELMQGLVTKSKTALILITHNLGLVVRYASRVYIMYAGRIVETASLMEIFSNSQHPYTQALWACVPRLDRSKSDRLIPLDGQPPKLTNLPQGCRFAPRCNKRTSTCSEQEPVLVAINEGHFVACHRVS